ncbi:zinc-dependent alcohol dehydrogenase family protein [Paucibacter sp. R3-3]|uniref:Zinc-dependent alcohol dehydrogenase family protein n=2 Tax=Roseateles agri TaxID=3098619 RepID=A0ABU5DKB0_9BURK|nr:zinc-dependent alcohol dehydrogenase family protein [Paucibacter sp. R3-3]MDY0745542.1 zinc-dependent alcohol dehydrogenase family protein [Paucibacter sp. R3-3]
MRAAFVETAGAAFASRRLPLPVAGPGQVLVQIEAAGLNPLDAKIRAGQAAHAKQPLPAVLGLDMAGTVRAVGAGVTQWRIGDEVFGMVGGVGGHPGTLAEFVAADARLLARRPVALAPREAAVLPLAFITAWEGLVDRARVGAGHKVLVHGGAGGVGQMAVQLARARGAHVWATGRADSLDAIAALGATPIDYRATTLERYVADATGGVGFDIVYDTVGGATLDQSFQAVRRYTGHVLTSLGWGSHSLAPLSFRGATYSGVFTLLPLLTGEGLAHHGKILAEAARLADQGLLRPWLDTHRFGLDEAEQAYALMGSGTARGKIAVEITAV